MNPLLLWSCARGTAVLGAALLLAVGCSAPAAPPPAGGAPSGGGAPSNEPAKPKVDRVVLAVEQPTRESLEIRHMSTPNGWYLTPMHENLLGIDPETGKKIPRLAEKWTIEPSGKGVRFNLRKGVRFHGDWGDFTANDLPYQVEQDAKDDSLAGTTPFWRQVSDGFDIVNEYEIVYKLKQSNGNFMDYVSDQLGGLEVTSKKAFDKSGPATEATGPIPGTGPYQFMERKEGQFARYKRVAYKHWRITPDFPEFEYRFVKEASTRLAALLAGEVHLTALSEDLLQQATKQGMATVKGRVPALRTFINFYCCAANNPKEYSLGYLDPESPLMNVKVRTALSKAINRDELNKGFFAGKGATLINNPLNAQRIGWNPDWEKRFPDEYGFDVAKAKQLLVDAGFGPSNPAKITMILQITPGLQASQDIAEAVANYWRNIGVNVALEQIDAVTAAAQNRAGKLTRHTWVQATNSNQWVGIYNFGTGYGRLPGVVGGSGPETEEIDRHLITIANTLDEKKIEEAWRAEGEALFSTHKFVPLFWLPVEVAVNPKIVSDWVLPGSISGSFTHAEYIKAAK